MKYTVMFLFLSVGVSTAADDAASKKLLKDLEGSYKVTGGEAKGEPLPARIIDEIEKVSIKGDKMSKIFKRKDGKSETEVQTITVDATKKPAHLEETQPEGGNRLHIVAIEGDTIKLCRIRGFGTERPTEFKTSKDDDNVLIILKKIKE